LKVLFINDFGGALGGAEVVIKKVRERSRHEIDLMISDEVEAETLDNYDLIHVHNANRLLGKLDVLNGKKYVVSLHDYRFDCQEQLKTCLVENKHPCIRCAGVFDYLIHMISRKRPMAKLVSNAAQVIVHSDYMRRHYSKLDPVYLPIPLEVEEMEPLEDPGDRGDYLFYSARCSPEKNPFDFVKLCRKLDAKGVMALDYLATRATFKDYVRLLRDENVEIYYDLELEKLFELYRHAFLTVHPHLYAEPFGIGSTNSILLGTPLIAYPHGNLAHLASFTAPTFEDLVEIVHKARESPEFYDYLLEKTALMREEFSREFDSIKKWDDFYEYE